MRAILIARGRGQRVLISQVEPEITEGHVYV